MSFLGLFTFRAPFLPWVLLGFSVLLGNSPSVDLMGIAVGHLYFFLDDVYPYTRAGRGRRPLRSPAWLLRVIDRSTWTFAGDVRARREELVVEHVNVPTQPPTPPRTVTRIVDGDGENDAD